MKPTLRHVVLTVALAALPAACTSLDQEILCADLDNEPEQQAVTVRVRNDGALPIFLTGTGCSTGIDLELTDIDGVPREWRSDGCDLTCEDQAAGPAACNESCAVPPVIYVGPGGVYEQIWDGQYLETRNLPQGCRADSDLDDRGAETCLQRVVARSGDYAITAQAFDVLEGCEDGACECEPDLNGSCQMDWSASPQGQAREATANFVYPTTDTITIVFE